METTASALQLWTSLATLVTAAAALFTVLEMRRQRQSGYRPDFVVEGESFKMRGNDQGCLVVVSLDDGVELANPSPAVRCANIGIAHAKDVRIEWDYDILGFVASIAEWDRELAQSIVLEHSLLRIGDESKAYSVHMIETQATHRFASVAPGPITSATRIGVPPAYVQLLCLYFGGFVKALPQSAELQAPELRLTIRYQDIGDKRHLRQFVILPKLQSMQTGMSGGDGTQKLAEVRAFFEVQKAT